MSISIRTNRSGKVTTPMMGEGWRNEVGLRSQIKRESKGVYTSRRDNVFMTNDYTLEAQKRLKMIGTGYGTELRVEGQTRGLDVMRTVDYSGSGSSSGVGNPLGKTPLLTTVANTDGILRSNIRGAASEGEMRQSVYNIKQAQNNESKYIFATTDQSRPVKAAASSALRDEAAILRITVEPTAIYTKVGALRNIHEGIAFKVNTDMINKNNIILDEKSGVNTQNRFETYKAHNTINEITKRINVSTKAREQYIPKYETIHELKVLPTKVYASAYTNDQYIPVYETEHDLKILPTKIKTKGYSGKQYLPKYETEHAVKDLPFKIVATDVTSNKSDPITYKRQINNDITLKPTRTLYELKATPRITQNTEPRVENYRIKNPRISLNQFSSNSNGFIPRM